MRTGREIRKMFRRARDANEDSTAELLRTLRVLDDAQRQCEVLAQHIAAAKQRATCGVERGREANSLLEPLCGARRWPRQVEPPQQRLMEVPE